MTNELSREEIVNGLAEKAEEYLRLSANCAQTSFLTLQDQLNLEDGAIIKALTPFPGIALRGETCGAVIGSLMALGLVYGRGRENLDDWQAYLSSLSPARKFCWRFEQEYGSTMCGDVIEKEFGRRFNLADPVESMEWINCGAMEKCGAVIGKAVQIAAEIILDK